MIISYFDCDGRSLVPTNFCEIVMPEGLTSLLSLILIGLTPRASALTPCPGHQDGFFNYDGHLGFEGR
jgi:hypothetical protein